MKFYPIEANTAPDFSNSTLLLPSCGQSNCDQMCIDILCFTFGSLTGRLLSDNLGFVCSPNPYTSGEGPISTSIDVYTATLPSVGKSVLLRVSANLPEQKRKLLNYTEEILEFTIHHHIKEIILVRSIPSIFCVVSQIKDWPFTIRGYGNVINSLGIKKIEEYSETQEILSNTVFGELFECFKKKIKDKDKFSAVFMFFQQEIVMECAKQLSQVICGSKDVKIPPSWEKLV